ncbi:MAG: hypothetical protein FWE05_12990 [Defluviitaleaceae bacterium]|nr:hypothetical protein [Defluviitaleaceae bacterium]
MSEEQTWKAFIVTGDPMHYLEYTKSRVGARFNRDEHENNQSKRTGYTGV